MPRDEGYVLYMLMAARRVSRRVANVSRVDFETNDEKKDAVLLQIGNIGEAANHVSSEYRGRHPEIPWPRIVAMRHRIFHGYEQIDWNRVWEIATVFVPDLIRLIEPLVPPEDEV